MADTYAQKWTPLSEHLPQKLRTQGLMPDQGCFEAGSYVYRDFALPIWDALHVRARGGRATEGWELRRGGWSWGLGARASRWRHVLRARVHEPHAAQRPARVGLRLATVRRPRAAARERARTL
jgi:hypothetical protein